MQEIEHPRTIRSFVKRQGRLTTGQAHALEAGFAQYGLTIEAGVFDAQKTFGRVAPLIVEIGFGMGQSLLEMAAHHTENDYLGIEVHTPGIGSLLMGVREQGLSNIRVYQHDAVEVLQHVIPDHSLSGVQIFFPDPWPKKRHHKRRLIQPAFVALLAQKLKSKGWLHCATDWQEYAEHMMQVLSAAKDFKNRAGEGQFADRNDRPVTKFERRGDRLGHGVWDLVFTTLLDE